MVFQLSIDLLRLVDYQKWFSRMEMYFLFAYIFLQLFIVRFSLKKFIFLWKQAYIIKEYNMHLSLFSFVPLFNYYSDIKIFLFSLYIFMYLRKLDFWFDSWRIKLSETMLNIFFKLWNKFSLFSFFPIFFSLKSMSCPPLPQSSLMSVVIITHQLTFFFPVVSFVSALYSSWTPCSMQFVFIFRISK